MTKAACKTPRAGIASGRMATSSGTAAAHTSEEAARTWLGISPNQSFFGVAKEVTKAMTVNRLQCVALGLVCEAMDKVQGGSSDDDGTQPQQHLQYVGGSGGNGVKGLALRDNVKGH